MVKRYDASDTTDPWKTYMPSGPVGDNDLVRVPLGSAFWVYLSQPDEWVVTGVPIRGHTIRLYPGTNLLGWPSETVGSLPAALNNLKGAYTIVWGYDSYNPQSPWKRFAPGAASWTNSLSQLTAGCGYSIQVTKACTLLVP